MTVPHESENDASRREATAGPVGRVAGALSSMIDAVEDGMERRARSRPAPSGSSPTPRMSCVRRSHGSGYRTGSRAVTSTRASRTQALERISGAQPLVEDDARDWTFRLPHIVIASTSSDILGCLSDAHVVLTAAWELREAVDR